MPMNRKLYPANWEEIAFQIKAEASWTCEWCSRPCRKPKESTSDLRDRIEEEHPDWAHDLFDEDLDDEKGVILVPKFTRFVLTVAHLDHCPENCDRSNLRALCAPCHCRYDLKAIATKRRLRAERQRQLTLDL